MKTKKVQRHRRKTLRQRGKALRHKKTLRMYRGGGDTITFTDNKNNKCIFEEVNNILVKRGENRIGTFDIDEKNFKYNELPVYDLGKSSTTPITKISSPKKTTPELDVKTVLGYKKLGEQSRAKHLELSSQFSNIKDNPRAGVNVQRMVENYRKIQNQQRFPTTRRRHQ